MDLRNGVRMAVRIESQAEPLPGYRLIERLGGGGFGEVWKAEAPGGLLKAIKFVYGDLQTGDDEDGVRAEQELKALSRVKTVRHPYILSLERYDIIEGQLLIVMELADRNLWDRFRECRAQDLPGIPRAELLGYMAETAEALDLMNKEYQLQHLDIKPQNLFLVYNHVKVADFGLVKDLEGMVASVTGGVTPVYAAPETFDGWISRFCDQYSLAIVYQELLTGHRPYAGSNVRQLIMQHLHGVPELNPLPPEDRDIIARALAKNPEDRFPTCHALVKALQEARPRPADPERPAEPAPAPVTPAPPSSGPVTRWIRAHDEGPQEQNGTGEVPTPHDHAEPAAGQIPMAGDGVLFPALVLGLGHLGLGVLQRLAAHLGERFGSQAALPHLRLLYLDTDPHCVRLATTPTEVPAGAAPLQRTEVLLAPLHRPSYYLKPRDSRLRIDTWLYPKMLYRIPRQAFSAGTRALGRLAFVDNYRTIVQRLRGELEECTDPEALPQAQARTGLGVRSNRPRVYVVTSLAGGTGSGMFLDLAYVVRTLLRRLGVERPDVVGLFLAPPVERGSGQTAVGNAYAALTELNHFSAPGTTFAANYETKEGQVTGPIVDPEAPFSRFVLQPMNPPERAQELLCQFLVADLTSPLGRSADMVRRERIERDGDRPAAPLVCQTFGLHRVVWPRRSLLGWAGRRLCHQLVLRWMSKDAKPVREQVKAWVQEQWASQELGAEAVIAQFHKAAETALGKAPETALAEITEPLVALAAARPGPAEFNPAAAADVLARLEQVLGKPPEREAPRPRGGEALKLGGPAQAPGLLEEALRTRAQGVVGSYGQKFAELAVCLIEQPAFRLAGAEEAIRQIGAQVEHILQHHEQLVKEFNERTQATYEGILTQLHALRTGAAPRPAAKGRGGWFGGGDEAGPSPVQHLADLVRLYGKSRYQSLVLQRVTAVFVALRGQLSDQLREVDFCRSRLSQMAKSFETAPAASPTETDLAAADVRLGRLLFPPGCPSLDVAVSRLLETVTPADLQTLDQRIEALIRQDFTALVHVCLASANMLKGLEAAMQQQAEGLLAGRLGGASVVDMFRAQNHAPDADARQFEEAISAAFQEAAPELKGLLAEGRAHEASEYLVLAAPAEPDESAGAPRLRDAVRRAVTGLPVVIADAQEGTAANEILLYREEACVPLADLKLLGPLGREAYRQMNTVEHFTPHTRIDITDWQAAGNP